MEEKERIYSIWTPITLTDKATGRTVSISIFEAELYKSGFFTFEDFWNGENPPEEPNEEQIEGNDDYVSDKCNGSQSQCPR